MQRIKQLPEFIAKQIAAGEVVERPKSILKELLENSIDAKSKNIEISMHDAGMRELKIIDDGIGIYKEDLKLALSQHATSKIYTTEDLFKINSLGFRGEAIASISSVAKVKITSKPKEQDTAYKIVNEEIDTEVLPAAGLNGTTVSVENLFYNVPARKRFLKSTRTEYLHMEDVLNRISLSNYDISFKWSHNGKVVKNLPVCNNFEDKQRRFASICGNKFVEQSVYIEIEQNGMKLYGWLGLPEFATSSESFQYFYINNRVIKDRLINHAIRTSYIANSRIEKIPFYCLYLELDVEAVDVNVHPTKHEVRFSEPRVIYAFINSALSEALEGRGIVQEKNHNNDLESHVNIFENLSNTSKLSTSGIEAKLITILDKTVALFQIKDKILALDLRDINWDLNNLTQLEINKLVSKYLKSGKNCKYLIADELLSLI